MTYGYLPEPAHLPPTDAGAPRTFAELLDTRERRHTDAARALAELLTAREARHAD